MFFKNIIGKDRDIVEEFNKEVCLLRDSTGEAAHKTVSEQIYEYVKEVSEESF